MEAARSFLAIWLLKATIECAGSLHSEDADQHNVNLTSAMDLIESGDGSLILWHSSKVECTKDFFCNMYSVSLFSMALGWGPLWRSFLTGANIFLYFLHRCRESF